MNKILLILFGWLTALHVNAYEPRDLLQKKANVSQVKEYLVLQKQWIKYPAYNDRAGWNALTGSFKDDLIKKGDQYINYEWKVITATDYLAYERTGSRVAMEDPFGSNTKALSSLLLAELAEGKGRFLDQIINGAWEICNMPSWSLSAHLVAQKSHRSLPDFNEQIIDLTSGDLGSFLSWTWYFFHDEMDKINPVVAARIKNLVHVRILEPYMARSDYWWQALNYTPGMLINNWNPWCNFNVLTCFLLLEDDKDKLAAGVYRTMESVDKFINYNHEDGACEEGPSYWGHAAGKMYDYLQLLSNATNNKINIFNEPIIKNMGEYIARSYVGNGWVVNFADASAKGGGDAGIIYRFGTETGSPIMQQFASYLLNDQHFAYEINAGRDVFRSLENLSSFNPLKAVTPALPSTQYYWYPQTQVCYMRNTQGFFFAAKGGFNNESHNHNDVGTFSLYLDNMPLFIDVGVGTYTRQTFSSERYSIWSMQSNYHSLPMINGVPQQFGSAFRAKDVVFNSKKSTLSMDISQAYPKEASVKKWTRTYTLASNAGLTIEDDFELAAAIADNQINFMTWAKPDVSKAGIVTLEKEGHAVQMKYDASLFSATVESIPFPDIRLSKVWGPEVYRLSLTAKKIQQKGKYIFTISKN
jgi:hypothetical protein